MKTIDLLGHEQEFRQCTLDDIEPHFATITGFIPAEEAVEFKVRMLECVEAGTAYTMCDGSCFLYYKNYTKWAAHGVALYGKKAPLRLLALFAGIFGYLDTVTFKMDFVLHPEKFVAEYKSLLTLTSLKRHHNPKDPLVIRIDHLRNKIIKLTELRAVG